MLKEIRYLISSFLSFFIQISLVVFLNILIKNENLVVLISMVLVFVINFLILKFFVYESNKNTKNQFSNVIKISIISRFLEFLFFYFLNELLNYNYMLIYFSILIISNIVKFFIYKNVFEDR
tara:strand:+ start:456 stop:821 length:366 start_codon:yes stop_codon:yes gene_type:complete